MYFIGFDQLQKGFSAISNKLAVGYHITWFGFDFCGSNESNALPKTVEWWGTEIPRSPGRATTQKHQATELNWTFLCVSKAIGVSTLISGLHISNIIQFSGDIWL